MRSKALIIGALWPNKDTDVLLAAERDGVLPHVKATCRKHRRIDQN
jgi:hypothetical protein